MCVQNDVEVLMRRLVAQPEDAADDLPQLMGRLDACADPEAADGPFESIASELVYDLSYYEPDAEMRARDAILFGEAKAVLIVADALARIDGLRLN